MDISQLRSSLRRQTITAISTYFSTGANSCVNVPKTFSSINFIAQSYFDTSALLEHFRLSKIWHREPAEDLPNNHSFSVKQQLTLPTRYFHFPAWGVPTLEDKYGFDTTIEFLNHPSYFVGRLPGILEDPTVRNSKTLCTLRTTSSG